MIITADDIKQYLGEACSATTPELEAIAEGVSAYIARETGRSFGEVKTVTSEIHDFANIVFLKNIDITALSELRICGTVIPAERYKWNKSGRVLLQYNWAFSANYTDFDEVQVDYTFGTTTVPKDLYLAALKLAKAIEAESASGATITKEQIGSFIRMYGTTPSKTQAMIDSYKLVRV